MVSGTSELLSSSAQLSKDIYLTIQCFVLGALTTHDDIQKPGPGQALRGKMQDVLATVTQGKEAQEIPNKYKHIVQQATEILEAHPSQRGRKTKAREDAAEDVENADASEQAVARVL